MSDDSVDFEVDLHGNTTEVAKKMANEIARLEAELRSLSRTHTKTERGFAQTKAFSPQSWKNIQNHAQHMERAKRSYTAMAPASAAVARGLRSFGVSGGFLRKFSIDAAKSEIALRRLYRLKGGGFSGAGAVASSLMGRGVAKYGGGIARSAGSAVMSGAATVGSAAATGGLILGAAAATGVGLLAHEMASTAIEAERVKFALDRVTNGDGARWWAQSADYAKRFGLNVNTVAENLMDMKASGFSDDMANTLFLRMGDLRALGATEETIGRALLAIRQVQAAGKLQGDELNQLSEAGINANLVYDELAKTMKKTVPQIVKLKEAGKLKAEDVIPAIAAAIGTKTGGGAAGSAGEAAALQTVTGQWGRLKGAFSVASADAIGTGMLEPLRTAMSSFTDWITGPGGQQAIGGFGQVIGKVFEKAPEIIKGVIWFLDEGLPAAMKGFSEGFASTGAGETMAALSDGFANIGNDNGQQAKETLSGLGATLGSLAGSLATVVGWTASMIEAFTSLGVTVNSVMDVLLGPAAPMIGFFRTAEGLFGGGGADGADPANDTSETSTFSTGFNMAQGLAMGMYSGSPAVTQAAADLGRAAEQALREQQQVHSPGRKMMEVGRWDARGYAGGFRESLPTVESAAAGLGDAAMRGASGGGASGASAAGGIVVQVFIDGKELKGHPESEQGEIIGEAAARAILRRLAYAGAA